MTVEHAAGPWDVERLPNGDNDAADLWAVCHPHTSSEETAVAILANESDARLIAAAPDLFDACQRVLIEARDPSNPDEVVVPRGVFDTLCAAIAKAGMRAAPVGRNPEGENARSAVESRSDEHAVGEAEAPERHRETSTD